MSVLVEMEKTYDSLKGMKVERRIYDVDSTTVPPGLTGIFEILWESGHVNFRGIYVEGALHGPLVCCWENGSLAQVGFFWKDKPVGIFTDYYDNGQKSAEGYRTSKGKEGVWKYFDKKGNLTVEEKFKEGEKV